MPTYLSEISRKSYGDLCQTARNLGVADSQTIDNDTLWMAVVDKTLTTDSVYVQGIADILPDGFGFVRSVDNSYLPSAQDVYIHPSIIKEYRLRKGDSIEGEVKRPDEKGRYLVLDTITKINFESDLKAFLQRPLFGRMTPIFPQKKVALAPETPMSDKEKGKEMTLRMTELIAPLGFGQRALIVAPPRTGKTVFIQTLAQSIMRNSPDTFLMVLLIDERPEEVTDMKKVVPQGEVVSSTFDQSAANHVHVAEMAIEKAKRLVEMGKDVVMFLDSITRLARAYNTIAPSSGKVLTGGVDANALQKPKRLFGSARNLEEGGSLSIIASALVETGSRMDEVIFEEFKGTGNAEIVLDRKMADKRIFPAIDVVRSGTRREELLVDSGTLKKMHLLRRLTSSMGGADAAEFLIDKLRATKDNADFFASYQSLGS